MGIGMLRAFFDGLCEPVNPGGVACYGFVIYRKSSASELKVFEGCGLAAEPGPDSTHNVAEYTGIIRAGASQPGRPRDRNPRRQPASDTTPHWRVFCPLSPNYPVL